jgi:hypothetical protein
MSHSEENNLYHTSVELEALTENLESEIVFEDETYTSNYTKTFNIIKKILRHTKIVGLIIVLIVFFIFFGIEKENKTPKIVSISSIEAHQTIFPIKDQLSSVELFLSIHWTTKIAGFNVKPDFPVNSSVTISFEKEFNNNWEVLLKNTVSLIENNTNPVDYKENRYLFQIPEGSQQNIRLLYQTNIPFSISLEILEKNQTFLINNRILISFILFFGVFALIIFDVVSRPLAGLFVIKIN